MKLEKFKNQSTASKEEVPEKMSADIFNGQIEREALRDISKLIKEKKVTAKYVEKDGEEKEVFVECDGETLLYENLELIKKLKIREKAQKELLNRKLEQSEEVEETEEKF